MSNIRTILVIGATGKQGGATVKALVEHNQVNPSHPAFNILALTRSSTSEAAVKLAALDNVKVIEGDLEDTARIQAIFKQEGIHGVFLVLSPLSGKEVALGKRVADIAAENGVKYLVYSGVTQGSFSSANPNPNPAWASKLEIESHIQILTQTSTLKYTFLRPTFFLESAYYPGFLNLFILQADKQKEWSWITVVDIGKAAAEALGDINKFAGKTIELAGDRLGVDEIAGIFRENGVQVEGKIGEGFLVPHFEKLITLCNSIDWDHSTPEKTKETFSWIKDVQTWLKEDAEYEALKAATA